MRIVINLQVGNMRSYNVTLFLDLEAKREAIRDVVAIYLIMPSKESIGRLIEDLNNELYDYFVVNFIVPCPEEVLENFAVECGRHNHQGKILQIFEHTLNYYSIAPRLFTLGLQDPYISLFRKNIEELEIDKHLSTISLGIFMFMRSNSFYPYIRYQRESKFGEKIALKICELFEKCEKSSEEEYGIADENRPLLVLLERTIDLHTPLHHPWKYIAMIHDVLGISNGKVSCPQPGDKRTDFELDFLKDKFLQKFAFQNCEVVGENIEVEFTKWKKEYEAITGKKAGEEAKGHEISSKLNEALDQVPEMTEKKIHLDAHTNITSVLYDNIKKRGIDKLVELELEIMTSKSISSKTKSEILAFLGSKNVVAPPPAVADPLAMPEAKVVPEDETIIKLGGVDRLRLLLLYILSADKTKPEEIKEMQEVLQSQYPNLELDSLIWALNYKEPSSAIKESSGGAFGSFFSSVTKTSFGIIEGLLSCDKHVIAQGMTKMMVEKGNPNTVTCDILIGPKPIDYKLVPKRSSDSIVVYMVGGGSYYEYETLQSYAEESKKEILYGCDYILRPEEFLRQLEKLSQFDETSPKH